MTYSLKNKNLLPFFLMIMGTVFSQNGKVKRANDNFNDYAFMDAIESYEELVEDGYSDEQIFKKLGNANYVNARYEEASQWYGKLVELEEVEIESEYYYRYAQSLKSIGDYEKSNQWMQRFSSSKSTDQRAKNFGDKEDYLERIKRNSGRYQLQNLSINSPVSDFAPSFRGNELIFSTARDTGITSRNIHQWNEGSFLNLHSAKVSENGDLDKPMRFSKVLNTKTHESSSTFSEDGNTIYFTRNNSQNGKFSRDGKGVSRLKVYKAIFQDDQWEKVMELPFNNADYSVAHPTLSGDGKTLYFSSDMPGSFGASDIFKVSINADGSFGEPENLGPLVNTESRETFPYVLDDVLYFSSDGHPGLGGLDVFAVKLDGSSNEVINLGKPLNSMQDDFSFIMDGEGKGYFASNREGGQGSDDIYGFVETEPLKFECISKLAGVTKTKDSSEILTDVRILFMNGDEIASETISDDAGKFEINLDCNIAQYTIAADKEGYLGTKQTLLLQKTPTTDLVLELTKEQPKTPVAGTNLLEYLKLNPVYFDLDKSNIRSDAQESLRKAVAYLKANPNVKIEVQSHTDAKASNGYNQRLSERRAKATVAFLVANGIEETRLVEKGFGESQLSNGCLDWSKCDDRENELNRRSDLIVEK
ncbi:MAG: OmpA family protein [Bacteroidota bacterium]